MSSVLTEANRGRAFTAVGSAEGLAQNFWDTWNAKSTSLPSESYEPRVLSWIHDYLGGVRESIRQLLDRDITIVTGSDALAGFLAEFQPDQARPAALANLARIVFNISREVEFSHVQSWSAPVVHLEASRLRFPELKRSREARASRTLSGTGELRDQLARVAQELPPGCQIVFVDDRLQSGGTLRAISNTASLHGLQPRAVLVAHSELPRTETTNLLPGVYIYAHCYDYASLEDRQDWQTRHKNGEVRMPISEELHDIISASPAAGEAVVYRYMEVLPQLKSIHLYLKEAFKNLVSASSAMTPIDTTDVKSFVNVEVLRKLGVTIRDEERFLSYFSERVLQHRARLLEVRDAITGSGSSLRGAEIQARWGADDIDRLFSHTMGCLVLRDCPDFNTDRADRCRFGAFFPFSHRDSLTIQQDLRARGPLHLAMYSLHELERTIELVDKWKNEYGEPSPMMIPHLAMPTIRGLMARRGKVSALDQLVYLRDILTDQIQSKDIRPLVFDSPL